MALSKNESAANGRGRERRSAVRLYKCWDAARAGKPLPRIVDFDFSVIEDLRSHIFLLGLEGPDRTPLIRYIGSGLTREVGRDLTRMPLSEVPRPSLLAQVAYQYLRVIADRQPRAVDGVFAAAPDQSLLHRGILLPFSDSGEAVDAVLGSFRTRPAAREASRPILLSKTTLAPAAPGPALEQSPPAAVADVPAPKEAAAAGALRHALNESRAQVEQALAGEAGSRRQLYRALAGCYGFFRAAGADPSCYETLLREAGIRPQPRAPFTPAVKLVFGAKVTKTQISEYAAVLSHVDRLGRAPDGVERMLEERGLKGCLRDERQARRAESGRSPASESDIAQAVSSATVLGQVRLGQPCDGDVALLLARRSSRDPAVLEVIALDQDAARLASAKRRLGGSRRKREAAARADQAA